MEWGGIERGREERKKGTWWGEVALFIKCLDPPCLWWVLNRTIQRAGLSHELHQLHWPGRLMAVDPRRHCLQVTSSPSWCYSIYPGWSTLISLYLRHANTVSQKLKHKNSIPQYSEYFCQTSSKSILVILSYTVSKLVLFWVTVYYFLKQLGRAGVPPQQLLLFTRQ